MIKQIPIASILNDKVLDFYKEGINITLIDGVPAFYPTPYLTSIMEYMVKASKKSFGDFLIFGNDKKLNIADLYKRSVLDNWIRYFLIWLMKNNHESAPIGNQNNCFRDMRKDVVGRMIQSLNSEVILDIGCDDIYSNENKYNARLVIGLDPYPTVNATNITYLSPKNINCDPIQKIYGFGESLPFKANTFDLIIYDGSFDHILDWKGALLQALSCLKKNGYVLISGLNWFGNESLIEDTYHFHHFASNEIISFMKRYGLKVVEIEATPWKSQDFRDVNTILFCKHSIDE